MSRKVTITLVAYSYLCNKSVVAELGGIDLNYMPDEGESLRIDGKRYDVMNCLDAKGKPCSTLSQLVKIEVTE